MTRVLSFESLSQLASPWNAEMAFGNAFQYLRTALPELSGFCGAVRFGSTAKGTFNPLSDLDILVVTSSLPQHGECNLGGITRNIQSTYRVQVSFEVVLEADAKAGCHSIERSIMQHIRTCAKNPENVIPKNPFDSLSWGNTIPAHYYISAQNELLMERLRYLDFQERRLTHGISLFQSYSEEKQLRFLGKILDAPSHITRKLFAHHPHHYDDPPEELLKILQSSCHLMSENAPVCALLQELLVAKRSFLATVKEQLACPNRQAYDTALQEILLLGPRVIAFNQAVKNLFSIQHLT